MNEYVKKIKIILIIVIIMIGIGENVFAENNTYKIEKSITEYISWESNEGGDIVISISNINLNSTSTYKYKLKYNNLETGYYEITSANIENNVLQFTLDKSKEDILKILKITDSAYLTVQELLEDNTTRKIMENEKIDISLSLSKAYKIGHFSSGYHGIAHTYGIEDIYYKYVKVENEEVIKKYLEYLETYDQHDSQYWGFYVDNLIDKINISKEIPTTGWEKLTKESTSTQPSEEGLYYIWIKAPKTEHNKELVGCVFSKRFKDIGVLKNQLKDVQEKNKTLIATVSYNPNTETTENVVATIKTNKKVNKVDGWILSEDGMSLTKTYYNNTTEKVHLIDVDNNETDVNITINNINKNNSNKNNNNKDTTVATGRLPQTGLDKVMVFGILAVIIVALVFFKRYYNYKDVK